MAQGMVVMAVEFDPAWEYFVADPEIEEVVYARRAFGFSLINSDLRKPDHGNMGFRFGNGNPNRCVFRLARPKRERYREEPAPRQCPKCGIMFVSRRCTVHCSKKCGCGAPKGGWGNQYTTRVGSISKKRVYRASQCAECGSEFRPRDAQHTYCSVRCASKVRGRRDVPVGFAEMYLSGVRMSVIAAHYGVLTRQLKRWRTKLGLPARPSGNHSKVRR